MAMRWYAVGMLVVSLALVVALTGCDDLIWQMPR